ncbi:MAG: hypothetical protein V4670_04065 [Bacteroidota bacterium]
MKKLQFILGAFLILFTFQSNAQVSVSLNIGTHPDWRGHYYEDRVQYVYLPELECYYDNYAEVYIYFGPQGWCRSRYMPEYCHGYDINRAHRVVIDYRGNSPWTFFDNHRNHYWRNNYRNYRQEYYGPNYNRRGNYVAAVDRRDNYRSYDNNRYEKRGNDYGYYKKGNNGRGNGNSQGHGNGNGRGNGRR